MSQEIIHKQYLKEKLHANRSCIKTIRNVFVLTTFCFTLYSLYLFWNYLDAIWIILAMLTFGNLIGLFLQQKKLRIQNKKIARKIRQLNKAE